MRSLITSLAFVSFAAPLSAEKANGTLAWIIERADYGYELHNHGDVRFEDRILVGDPTLLNDGYYFPTLVLEDAATAQYVTITETSFGDLTKAILLFSDETPVCGRSLGRTEELASGTFLDPNRIAALAPLFEKAATEPDAYWTDLGLWPRLTKVDAWSTLFTLDTGERMPAYSNWDSGYYPVYAFYGPDLALAALVVDHRPTTQGEVDMPTACD